MRVHSCTPFCETAPGSHDPAPVFTVLRVLLTAWRWAAPSGAAFFLFFLTMPEAFRLSLVVDNDMIGILVILVNPFRYSLFAGGMILHRHHPRLTPDSTAAHRGALCPVIHQGNKKPQGLGCLRPVGLNRIGGLVTGPKAGTPCLRWFVRFHIQRLTCTCLLSSKSKVSR